LKLDKYFQKNIIIQVMGRSFDPLGFEV